MPVGIGVTVTDILYEAGLFRIVKNLKPECFSRKVTFSFDNIFAQTNHRRENKSFNFCVSLSLLFPEIFFALFT